VRGEPIVGFVSRRGTKKLSNLREHSRVTVVFRSKWEWVAVEGDAELAGPDDPLEGFAASTCHSSCATSMPQHWRKPW
jgi:hypothetical protein